MKSCIFHESIPHGHDKSVQGQIIDKKIVIKMNTKKTWDDEYDIHKNIKNTLLKNKNIPWYSEGHCLMDLKVSCILATVSLRTSSKTKEFWSFGMRWGWRVWTSRWIILELKGQCFIGARNLHDLDGGWMKINSFVGTSLACFLVNLAQHHNHFEKLVG